MKKKIDFLNRLFDLLKCRLAILEFLKEEKLVDDNTIQNLMNEHHSSHAQKMISMLEELSKSDKLQLVDYEWTILPFEKLKLTLVSNNHKKEFEYAS